MFQMCVSGDPLVVVVGLGEEKMVGVAGLQRWWGGPHGSCHSGSVVLPDNHALP